MATQSLLLTLCLLNLCVVVLGGGGGPPRNCFNTACRNGDSLTACVAGHWQCHHGETCLISIKHDATVSMTCDQPNHAHCEHANHNDASCAPLVYPPPHDCLYCCDTEQCVRDIEAGGVNTPLQHQGCFTVFCDHHTHLESCVQGPWSCNANQYCRFEAHKNGDIIMLCEDYAAHWEHCQDATNKNQATCSPLDYLPPPSDCKYCCTDQSCIFDILTSSQTATTTTPTTTTTPAPTTTTTTPAPTTTLPPGHLHPGKASCFTSACEHVDVAQCISGQWACTANQYCHVQGQPDGTLHMNCDDIAHYVECSNHFSHNLPECQVSIQGHCQYCCHDADCVRRLASVPATQPPATTTTKSTSAPTIATAAPTATPAPSTLTPAPTTSTPATTTAPTMPPATTTPAPTTLVCMDNLPNNGCSLVMKDCTDLTVMEVCRKTCGVCGSSSVHTTAATASPSQTATATASPVQATSSTQSPPQTTAAPTQAPTQTTAAPTQAPTQTTAAPTQTTTTTPSPTQTAATASPTTAYTTATTSDPHTTHPHNAVTTPPQLRHCVQCGDYANKTKCTDTELFHDVITPCPDTSTPYCQTDVMVDSQSNVAIYKRCVNLNQCNTEWYSQTSDKPLCLNFDPMGPLAGLTCHFCCTADGCNDNIVPVYSTQWRP